MFCSLPAPGKFAQHGATAARRVQDTLREERGRPRPALWLCSPLFQEWTPGSLSSYRRSQTKKWQRGDLEAESSESSFRVFLVHTMPCIVRHRDRSLMHRVRANPQAGPLPRCSHAAGLESACHQQTTCVCVLLTAFVPPAPLPVRT